MPKNFFQKNIKNNIKKNIKNNFKIKFLFTIFSFISFSSSFFISKTSANVGVDNINSGIENIGSIVTTANKTIAGPVVLFLSAACTILFLWFLIIFLIHRNGGGEKDSLPKDKKNLLWSMVALFILVTIWGIIQIAEGILGITEKNKNIKIGKICLDDSCGDSSTSKKSSGGSGSDGGEDKGDNSSLKFNSSEQKFSDAANTSNDVTKNIKIGQKFSIETNQNDTGVAFIQRFLVSAGCYENKSIDQVSKVFDENTKKALSKWQKFNGVFKDGDGVFGADSWNKMNSINQKLCQGDENGEFQKYLTNERDRVNLINNIVNKANQIESDQSFQEILAKANSLERTDSTRVSTNVKNLNEILKYLKCNVDETSVYNPNTIAAVKKLQIKYKRRTTDNRNGEDFGTRERSSLIEELESRVRNCFK